MVMVAGQGGDGSLTLANLVAEVLAGRGFHLYLSRDVASRIKGGHAAAYLRGSVVRRGCLGDSLDLVVAFDSEAVERAAPRLTSGGLVVFDSSDGPLDRWLLPEGTQVVEVPFGRLAVRDLRRDLYKNSLAFGVVARLMGITVSEAETALRRSLSKLSAALVEANVRAMFEGFSRIDGVSDEGVEPWILDRVETGPRLWLSGNEAVGLGFVAAGGGFFAGYPITPASEILETLEGLLPEVGGVVVQAEDELAAANMVLGASLAGVRAMTASSGPGVALMQEAVSHAGSAEIPMVVVDCQRAGPSTGMPTKPEQSDIGMLVWGAPGDFPRVVLAAGDPRDCFELAGLATGLAELWQGPVYLVLDQAVSQDQATVDFFDVTEVEGLGSRRVSEADLAGMDEYRRYAITDDGISLWAVPGTVGGESLVTGNERNDWGRVSTDPENRTAMVDKRARKLAAVVPHLPAVRVSGPEDARIGILGFGMQTGVIRETAERLTQAGMSAKACQVRTLWPVTDDLRRFVSSVERVFVVEHNAEGQYRRVLVSAGVDPATLIPVLRYDGVAFGPGELAELITTRVQVPV